MDTTTKVEVIIFYQNEVGEFKLLILKRSEKEGGWWQPLVGGIKEGETVEVGMFREIEEETGLTEKDIVSSTDTFYTFDWGHKENIFTDIVRAVELNTEKEIKLSEEHQEFKWVTMDEAIELMRYENNKEAFRKFKEKFIE